VAQKLGLGAADIVQFRDLVAKAQSTLAATAAK
jgi:hypothetical protein